MSTLILVRHGQANYFGPPATGLTALGEAQARKLGAYWVAQQLRIDEVCTGTLKRQQRTAVLAGEAYAHAGLPWPAQEALPDLNEYDFESILSGVAPQLAAGSRNNSREFQQMFEALVAGWVEGGSVVPGVETWIEFRERVRRAISRVLDGPRGRRVAVFTSGGPIAVAMQMALGAPDAAALSLAWRVRNCSLTEFLFTKGRFTLDAFNTIPHLDDPAMWTYL